MCIPALNSLLNSILTLKKHKSVFLELFFDENALYSHQKHTIMLFKELGNTIKERRSTLVITQKHLAELAEVSVNSIVKIENGKMNPSVEMVDRIAEILGMELTLQVKKVI